MGVLIREDRFFAASVSLTPALVAPATSAEQTFTVTGLKTGDIVSVNKPTADAGVGIVNARVSAADTLALTFMNATAASVTPTAAESYKIMVYRPEKTESTVNA